MCCSVRGDILGAFASIFAAVEAGHRLDGVLIETTGMDQRSLARNGLGNGLDCWMDLDGSSRLRIAGMADPLPIIRTLCNTPQIARVFGLNGIVTLVDAKNVIHRLREVGESDMEREEAEEAAALAGTGPLPPDEAFQQIMFADRVVLSKVDLVDTATAIEVRFRMDLGWISDGSRMDLAWICWGTDGH